MKTMIPRAHPLPDGLVIMFEGIDGVGKTTQLDLARKTLEDAGWPVVATRNLGGTPIGEALREVILSPVKRPPMTDFYVSLAIQEPLLGLIDSARKEGKIVLMDRGPLSLAAYQIFGSEIPESIGWGHVKAGMERIRPEAVIFYDTDVKTALQRRSEAKSDYFESKSPQYFERVAEGYRKAAGRFDTVITVDAAQDIQAVQEQTMAAIAQLLA
jgi:dTMP kinase